MFDFQQKRRFRAVWSSRLLWIPLVFILMLVTFAAYGRYQIARDMAERRATAEEELLLLKDREADLLQEVDYLGNERGIEAAARRQFDIALPGEEMIIILDATSSPAGNDNATTTVEERPWYRLW